MGRENVKQDIVDFVETHPGCSADTILTLRSIAHSDYSASVLVDELSDQGQIVKVRYILAGKECHRNVILFPSGTTFVAPVSLPKAMMALGRIVEVEDLDAAACYQDAAAELEALAQRVSKIAPPLPMTPSEKDQHGWGFNELQGIVVEARRRAHCYHIVEPILGTSLCLTNKLYANKPDAQLALLLALCQRFVQFDVLTSRAF